MSSDRKQISGCLGGIEGAEGGRPKEHEEIWRWYVHCLDRANGFMGVYVCQTLPIKYFKYVQLSYQL